VIRSAGCWCSYSINSIEIGTQLRLCLMLGDEPYLVDGRVVRVQEPAWGVTPGWGVEFDHSSEESRRTLERFVAARM
jgi:hypothetical protein